MTLKEKNFSVAYISSISRWYSLHIQQQESRDCGHQNHPRDASC